MDYSVVIPAKNESQNLPPLIDELQLAMQSLKASWELIVVDDGSTDNTVATLVEKKRSYPCLNVLQLDKNYGQSAAMWAGFQAAKGHRIITLDGDGQNDPQDIPHLIQHMDNYHLICGWRKKRKDTCFKRLTSKLANALRSKLCKDGLHDTGCSLKIYDKQALLTLPPFQGMHRFLPALFAMRGFKIKEIPVNHRHRHSGTSHYNLFNRSFNTIKDLLGVYWLSQRVLNYSIKEYIE